MDEQGMRFMKNRCQFGDCGADERYLRATMAGVCEDIKETYKR